MKTPSLQHRRVHPAGFTLIEIMLVIGIIVILMGAVLTQTKGFTTGAKITAAEQKITSLSNAIRSYENVGGTVPSTEQGLRALVEKPGGRPSPSRWVKLVENKDLLDPWQIPFAYYSPARKGDADFEIVSAGPDKKMNTADDISSEKPE